MLFNRRTWAEINLDNLAHNFRIIDSPSVCCVIKANAYGHGAIQCAKEFENLGAFYFAVSNVEEAIQLRKNGIIIPILILGYTPFESAEDLSKYNLDQTVYNLDYALRLNDECVSKKIIINIHIKIDTGMGRIGFQYHDNHNELNDALRCCRLSNLNPIGIFTHFSSSDEDINDYTNGQFRSLKLAIKFFEENGVFLKIKHCSNSAAIINYPFFDLSMVRAGISLYGISPIHGYQKLKPVLSLWSVVSNIKKVNKGDCISYGRTFIAPKDMTVATIPIGYADGFWRSNQGHLVYINGEYCKIIGRVCMDQIMVECSNACIGDLVEIYGEHITVEAVADYNKTIPYEILCSIGERVPRIYKRNNTVVEIVDRLV